MPAVSTYGVSVIILEVKYDNYLPDIIRNMIQVENRKATAFSKYAVARMFGYTGYSHEIKNHNRRLEPWTTH